MNLLSNSKKTIPYEKFFRFLNGTVTRPFPSALRVTAIYALIGILWIVFSDKALNLLVNNPAVIERFSMIKGVLYVLVTAGILYQLIYNALSRLFSFSTEVNKSYDRLCESYTLLKENQSKLTASEAQYRQLYNSMQSSYCVLELVYDENGKPCNVRFLKVNPAFQQVFGLNPEQTIGKLISELTPSFGQKWLDEFVRVVETGQAIVDTWYFDDLDKFFEIRMFSTAPSQFSAIINDVTEKRRMEDALYTEKERLMVTLNSIGDGVIATGNDGRVTMLNGVAEQITGWPHKDALGKHIDEVLRQQPGQHKTPPLSAVQAVIKTGKVAKRSEYMTVSSADGSQRIIADSAAPIRGSDGAMLGAVLVLRDVTEQHTREERILYLSYHDMLTGLYNRAFFEEEIRRLDTARQLPLVVLMGDVNNLKLVNDVFGHHSGDELLITIAQILKESCRTEDIISRWGGDEFTILLPKTGNTEAEAICERIQRRCAEYKVSGGVQLKPSISLGFSVKTSMDSDINGVIKTAESYMYNNKISASKDINEAFIESMLQSLYEEEGEISSMAKRIVGMCSSLGREMDMKERELEGLRMAALLHDVGKVVISRDIIAKPDGLTQDEWEEIKRHPGIGYRIARSTPELVGVSGIILSHHERWDGSGYPNGLKGVDIPLESRIIAVVDAYDAMTQGRPYKAVKPAEEAISEIVRYSGTQFDPEVVNAFICVIGTADEPLFGMTVA
jgi:diguanylate cyclase (GGDEF)-like protein/PAS domain S-box-containing protein